MEQNLNDKPLSNMQIARYIESLRKEMNFATCQLMPLSELL